MYYAIKIDYTQSQVDLVINQPHSSPMIAISEIVSKQNQICIEEGNQPDDQYATDDVAVWSWMRSETGKETTLMMVAGNHILKVVNDLGLKVGVDAITHDPIRFSRKIGRKENRKMSATSDTDTISSTSVSGKASVKTSVKVQPKSIGSPLSKLKQLFNKVNRTDHDWEISCYDLIVFHWRIETQLRCAIFLYDEMLFDMLSALSSDVMCIYSDHHWLTSNYLRDEAGTKKSFKSLVYGDNSEFWLNELNECKDFGDVHYRLTDGSFYYSEEDDIWKMDYIQ